jgi:hypothetical protein
MTSHFLSLPRVAALSVAITVLASPMAAAQTPVSPPPADKTVLPAQGLVASPADVKRAVGTQVRVTFSDRSKRKGTLVSLSASGVVLRTGDGEAVIPLAQVWKVDKTSHRVRKGAGIGLLAGLGFGALMWAIAPCEGECPQGADVLGVAIMAGIGAGVGALIGGGKNLASADRDAIYDAGRSTVHVAPILSPRRAGLAMAVRW